MNRTGFQSFVNAQLPPAVPGDFSSVNPRTSTSGPAEGYHAAAGGVYVGRFAWGNPATGLMSNYYQAASNLAFIHRENQALITDWMGIDSLLVPEGYQVAGLSRGDMWGLFLAGASIGQSVYADAKTGVLSADDSGNAVSVDITASIVASTLVMTVTAVSSADLAANQIVTGVGIPAGVYIASQLTGSAGDTGTYQLALLGDAFAGNVSSESMVSTGSIETPFTVASVVVADASVTASIADDGVMTVTAVGSGALEVGQFLSGANLTDNFPNAQITAFLTGTGDTGTYQTTYKAVATSATVVATQGQAGKITTW